MKAAGARIRKATEAWFITEPLLFSVWIGHRLAERPGVGSLRTGAGRIEYNPAFIDALPDRALAEVLRVEAVRLLLKHPYARRPDDPERAWLASNITLKEHIPTQLPLPSAREVFGGPEHDRQYFERYYDLLQGRPTGPATGGGGPGKGEGEADGGGPGEGEGGGGASESGGSGKGEAEKGADPVAGHFAGGENTGLWEEDSFQQEEINEAIRAAQGSDAWGTLPGHLRSLVLASLRPRLDYRRVLRHFRTSILSSRRELTRMKPSRRYGFLYMGSRHRLRTRLLVAVDVSGSIGHDEIGLAYGVVGRLFQYGVETIDVIQFDTQVTGKVESLRKARQKVQVTGGGGTDFSPVMAYIDEHRDYDGLIIITDGIAPVPEPPKNRDTRVLWLFNTQGAYESMNKDLGKIGPAAYVHTAPSSAASSSSASSSRSRSS